MERFDTVHSFAAWLESNSIHGSTVPRSAAIRWAGHLNCVEADRAALREQVQWQPISTAPKDGKWFLGWQPEPPSWGDGRPFICTYDHSDGRFYDVAAGINDPTHWIPIPPPPERSET